MYFLVNITLHAESHDDLKMVHISIFYEVFSIKISIFPSYVDSDSFKLNFYYVTSYIQVLKTNFELIFAYYVRKCSNLLIYSQLTSFPWTTCSKDCLFVYSCLLYHRLIDHRCVGIFQTLYSVPVIYVSVSVLISCCFHTAIQYCLKSGSVMVSVLLFFP